MGFGENVAIVSIITPTFRRSPVVVQRCIGCVLLQTMQDWEQIVCSDGEKEGIMERLVAVMGDNRVRYRFLGEKKDGDFGNNVRQRMLIEEAKGKYVVFLDDDNIIMPDFLTSMVNALDVSGADFAVCSIVYVYPDRWSAPNKPPILLCGVPVANGQTDPLQIMVRIEVMKEVGWNVDGGYNADGEVFDRLGEKYKHVKVDGVLGVHL